jgi:hypothetical protein
MRPAWGGGMGRMVRGQWPCERASHDVLYFQLSGRCGAFSFSGVFDACPW